MKKTLIYILFGLFFFTGCITNDIPYPVVIPHVNIFDVENAVNVSVDADNQVITVHFAETVDMRNVKVRSVEFEENEAVLVEDIVGYQDFTKPFKFTIRTYSDYVWTVKGIRDVERYFTVAGQIGATEIDAANCRAIATVSVKTPLDNIEVTSLKLGPEGLTEYSLQPSQMKDFTHGVTVEVTAFGQTEEWTLFVDQTDSSVDITKVNPWTKEAYVTSFGIAGMENGFQS